LRLIAGERWKSVVSDAQIVVVRGGSDDDVALTCGGAPMVGLDAVAASTPGEPPEDDPQTLIGKRYVDDETDIELLCTKSGAGALRLEGRALALKQAKALPSSD
jgi:hypothetical protein